MCNATVCRLKAHCSKCSRYILCHWLFEAQSPRRLMPLSRLDRHLAVLAARFKARMDSLFSFPVVLFSSALGTPQETAEVITWSAHNATGSKRIARQAMIRSEP